MKWIQWHNKLHSDNVQSTTFEQFQKRKSPKKRQQLPANNCNCIWEICRQWIPSAVILHCSSPIFEKFMPFLIGMQCQTFSSETISMMDFHFVFFFFIALVPRSGAKKSHAIICFNKIFVVHNANCLDASHELWNGAEIARRQIIM